MINNNTLIIAEAGVNHNGSMSLAKEMIAVAANAKADYVKFQSYKTEELLIKSAEKANYQKQNTIGDETQFKMLKKYELSIEDHHELIKECKKYKINFLSSPFDISSAKMLHNLDLKLYKIPSSEITNIPYLEFIGSLQKKIILSTGMSTLNEIELAIDVLKNSGTSNISVLHCNTDYPTPLEHVNLRVINTLKKKFNLPIGYSDHTIGITVPIAAVSFGAEIIEKHFTLDKSFDGPDHLASLSPSELIKMVKEIRNVEKCLGSDKKTPTRSESKNINVARKSIVAKTNIKKGECFTEKNITTKRPGYGLSPLYWHKILNTKSANDYSTDDLIKDE